MLIERFNKLYDECIPLRKYKMNRLEILQSPWITNGTLSAGPGIFLASALRVMSRTFVLIKLSNNLHLRYDYVGSLRKTYFLTLRANAKKIPGPALKKYNNQK